MKKDRLSKQLFGVVILATLALLPGCEWFGKKSEPEAINMPAKKGLEVQTDGSTVIVSIDGQPVVTEKSLEIEFEQLLKDNPQLAQILPMMPDAKKNFAMGMINQILVDKFIGDNGIDQQKAYVQDRERMLKSVDRMLNTKYFTARFPVTVTDAQVTEFYEKNKNSMPDLLLSQGGVTAMGVQFDKEDAVKDFLLQATVQKDVNKAAQAAGIKEKLRDFKVVNEQTMGMDPKLREQILSITKFPSTKVIKVDDKTFWVVQASKKEDKKYRPLEQIKPQLKQYIEKEKQAEVVNGEIDNLKKKYDVVVNEEFFAKQAPQGSQGMPAGLQQMMQQQTKAKEVKAPEQKVAKKTEAPKVAQAA